MSSKINISDILKGHLDTLKVNGSYDKADLFTFFLIPLVTGILCAIFGVELNKDILSLFVNFGAIFTALLLSLLVLVYDQEAKVKNAIDGDALKEKKSALLKQLYHNISFAIFCAVILVFMCFIHTALFQKASFWIFDLKFFNLDVLKHIISPAIISLVGMVFLVIIMILKRVHALLFVD